MKPRIDYLFVFFYILLLGIIYRLCYVNVTTGPLHRLLHGEFYQIFWVLISIVITTFTVALFTEMTRMLLKRGS